MKHLFIVNPVAGGKDRREYVAEQARRALEGSEDAYEVYVTTAPMDATQSDIQRLFNQPYFLF